MVHVRTPPRLPRRWHIFVALLVAGCLILGVILQAEVHTTVEAAATFVVTNTGDGGAGSLRQAILDSNATPGVDMIAFNINSGQQTIAPTSSLPDISDPVVIDGTTQPGFAGRPLIELSAANYSGLPNRGVLHITGGGTTVRGLIINRFRDPGIAILTVGGNRIEGNYIGTDATGSAATNCSGTGIAINNAPNNVIGGTTPSSRNVISGTSSHAISVFGGGGNGNIIQGNYIGTDAAGTARLGNFSGIYLGTSNNTVGGTFPGARNIISAGVYAGIVMQVDETSGNVIQGNYIGTDVSGTVNLGNTDYGIAIFGSSNNNVIGGTRAAARNVISGNGWGVSIAKDITYDRSPSSNVIQGNYIGVAADGATPLGNRVRGVRLAGALNTTVGGASTDAGNVIAFTGPAGDNGAGTGLEVLGGAGNSIRGNFIFSNSRLGVDLDSDGVTPNDPGDGDAGGNNRQNFPLITSVVSDPAQTVIAGTINSTANTTFAVDFYSNAACDPAGSGEGARPFGSSSTSVTTDSNGNGSFNSTLPAPLPAGRVITATATDPAGNTSEYSPCNPGGAVGVVQFSSAAHTVLEDVGFTTIKVNRVGGSSGTLSVEYASTDGTASAGQDYAASSGVLNFADGETIKTFDIPILSDALLEPEESLTLSLRNPADRDSVGAQSTMLLTIRDQSARPTISVNSVSVSEGNAGTTPAVFTVSLFPETGRTVTVNFTTLPSSALAGTDFQPISGSLTFGPRVTAQTITVPVVGDVEVEPDELFYVRLTAPANAGLFNGQGLCTILNDDQVTGPPRLMLEESGLDTTQAAALDSLSFLRDPFKIVNGANLLNQGADRNTRIAVFVTNLQMPRAANSPVVINIVDVNGGSHDLTAEAVRSLPGTSLIQVVFRLPDNLPPGRCVLTVKADGQSSNSGAIRVGI